LFFFSSRRRHTIFKCDWSSDVCSSDLEVTVGSPEVLRYFANMGYGAFDYRRRLKDVDKPTLVIVGEYDRTTTPRAAGVLHEGIRSEERRVGKGARGRRGGDAQRRGLGV